MIEIIPALLVKTEAEFRERLSKVESLVSWAQIDVVDGKFAANVTWGDAAVVGALDTPLQFEIDLMVANPEEIARQWLIPNGPVRRIYFHEEAAREDRTLLRAIRAAGIEAGLSFNPESPVEAVFPFIEDIDSVLFLGVKPGFQGTEFHQNVINKVAEVRKKFPTLSIEVDGGVTPKTVPALVRAGVSRLAIGSFLFNHPGGPQAAIDELRHAIEA